MIQLEALDEAPPSDRRVGPRCEASHSDLGPCNRHCDHAPDDPWHHALTGADPALGVIGQYWRWRDT